MQYQMETLLEYIRQGWNCAVVPSVGLWYGNSSVLTSQSALADVSTFLEMMQWSYPEIIMKELYLTIDAEQYITKRCTVKTSLLFTASFRRDYTTTTTWR